MTDPWKKSFPRDTIGIIGTKGLVDKDVVGRICSLFFPEEHTNRVLIFPDWSHGFVPQLLDSARMSFTGTVRVKGTDKDAVTCVVRSSNRLVCLFRAEDKKMMEYVKYACGMSAKRCAVLFPDKDGVLCALGASRDIQKALETERIKISKHKSIGCYFRKREDPKATPPRTAIQVPPSAAGEVRRTPSRGIRGISGRGGIKKETRRMKRKVSLKDLLMGGEKGKRYDVPGVPVNLK